MQDPSHKCRCEEDGTQLTRNYHIAAHLWHRTVSLPFIMYTIREKALKNPLPVITPCSPLLIPLATAFAH